MEEQDIKAGDTVNHKFIGKHKELFVAACNGTKAVTRYFDGDLFHTYEFYVSELEIYVPKKSNIGALRGI